MAVGVDVGTGVGVGTSNVGVGAGIGLRVGVAIGRDVGVGMADIVACMRASIVDSISGVAIGIRASRAACTVAGMSGVGGEI